VILNITGIKLSLAEGEKQLAAKLAALLSLPEEALLSLKVLRKSLDARRSRPPFFIYGVEAGLADNIHLPNLPEGEINISVVKEREPVAFADGIAARKKAIPSRRRRREAGAGPKVAVVGSGPAGLFAALTLAEKRIPVLILERGKEVSARSRDVQAFWEKGELNGESNVHFGEGGAGAFSDGKLTSRINNPRIRLVKEALVESGAPADILSDAKPHIGTDRLREVVKNFRERLLDLGCEIRFGARVSDFLIQGGRVSGIVVNGEEEIRVDRLILAMGQNAEDTYAKLRERGVQLEPKPFAMGLRVEHPQQLINEIQYGKWRLDPALPPADYFLTAGVKQTDRSVYTFCMCPGGQIIGCSSEPGRVVTNGMSRSVRDGLYANSAVVVNVRTGDFLGTPQEPLKGLEFRRRWEERAFFLGGGNYYAPAQRLTDFLQDRGSDKLLHASFLPGIQAASLRDALPEFVTEALQEGLRLFDRKMPGFITEEAMLVGVETRTSSPVRILREANGQSVGSAGLYPCGEGAGYAGGIISSALDGIKAAESLMASIAGHL
jgi:uncharacterized FAD-dependent dehydrogenase